MADCNEIPDPSATLPSRAATSTRRPRRSLSDRSARLVVYAGCLAVIAAAVAAASDFQTRHDTIEARRPAASLTR